MMAKFEIMAVMPLNADNLVIGGKFVDGFMPGAKVMQVNGLRLDIIGNNMLAGTSDIYMHSFTVAGVMPRFSLIGLEADLSAP